MKTSSRHLNYDALISSFSHLLAEKLEKSHFTVSEYHLSVSILQLFSLDEFWPFKNVFTPSFSKHNTLASLLFITACKLHNFINVISYNMTMTNRGWKVWKSYCDVLKTRTTLCLFPSFFAQSKVLRWWLISKNKTEPPYQVWQSDSEGILYF